MALRTSGHLLVGLSRIYAKKVVYLLTDSTETLATLSRGKATAAVDLDIDEDAEMAAERVTRDRAPAKEKMCVRGESRVLRVRLPPRVVGTLSCVLDVT